MTRTNQLKNIRPQIPTILEEHSSSISERFQNQTLRPILKFQHDLIIQIFKEYIQKRKGVFLQLSATKRLAYIEQSIQKDLKFKHLMLGVITGHFTVEEWKIFTQNEKELRKRIGKLVIQRLQSEAAAELIQ